MDNLSFYGLTKNPFNKENTAESGYFDSRDFREMRSRLEYLKDIRGIGLFTAPPGMGKSYCLRCFAKNLNPNIFTPEYIRISTVGIMEFYRTLCYALGLSDQGRKAAMFRAIHDEIYALYKTKRRPLVLAIDEAHELSDAVLRDLKMLMNFEYDSLNCFTLILAGEPQLNSRIMKPLHDSLRQRITVHYNFHGLDDSEVASYILHKIESAGGTKAIISDAAIAAVHSSSAGNPRTIDTLMTDALMIGCQHGTKVIDAETIRLAAENQKFD